MRDDVKVLRYPVIDVNPHSAANAVGKMPDVFPASGLLGLAVLFTSVNPAAGFTACSPQRGPGLHNARTACVMQTSQPNAEAARLAKLNVPQLREELGKQGLAKGGTKAELVQRLLAQPVVHTLHFKCRNEIGELEDLSVNVTTQDDFDRFANVGAPLFSTCKTTRKRVYRVLTLSEALAVAADPTVYLTQQQPFDVAMRTVNNLEAYRQNTASDLVQTCNRAAVASLTLTQLLGTLTLLNDGHSVKFYKKNKNLNYDNVMEVDGILLNRKVVVMNEVKNSPSLRNVEKFAGRKFMFGGLLLEIAATPENYKTEPESVRDELVKWMNDAESTAVELVMSGYDFSTEAQDECRARSIHVIRSNGDGYSVITS